MNPKVDAFLRDAEAWRDEMRALRKIALGCRLTEELKWGKPCYMHRDSNVVIIIPFKATCALLFTKGSLLKDPRGILVKPGEHTQASRFVKFTSVRQITKLGPLLKAYIREAVEAEKAGLKVKYRKNTSLKFPPEFQKRLDDSPALKAAFSALTPGRQRAYNIYFSGAKQSETRSARVEKCVRKILDGEGINDAYMRAGKAGS